MCLHFPVRVSASGTQLSGELYLPKGARGLTIRVVHGESEVQRRRMAVLLAAVRVATRTIQSETPLSSGEMLYVIDWVRSRRLLQSFQIGLMAPRADRDAALKAASRRPVSVSAVYTGLACPA